MIKQCVVCGADYKASPSDKRSTCGSKECVFINKSRTHKGKPYHGKKLAYNPASLPNLRLGCEAALRSPKGGRKETHISAKVWILISPDGEEITVRNLSMWARANCALFGKPSTDASAHQIASGFKAIAQTLSGYRSGGKRRPATTYFGWTLKCLPVIPEATDA